MCARNLCCGLSEPGFESRLAERGVTTRNQCFLANFRSRVTRVWISDDFAGIFERRQTPPDKFIQAKLFRATNFDDAVCWLTYRNFAHSSRDVVRGHRLEEHGWQMHLAVNDGNVGD